MADVILITPMKRIFTIALFMMLGLTPQAQIGKVIAEAFILQASRSVQKGIDSGINKGLSKTNQAIKKAGKKKPGDVGSKRRRKKQMKQEYILTEEEKKRTEVVDPKDYK